MKIRSDFITNSSSSSFISIKITNQAILDLIKGSGLEEVTVSEDGDLNHSGNEMLAEFHRGYPVTEDAVSSLQQFLMDKYNAKLTHNDFVEEVTTSGYGEAAFHFAEEYGVEFDSFIETNQTLKESCEHDDDGYFDAARSFGSLIEIEFHSEGKALETALKSKADIRKNIIKFFKKYGTVTKGASQLVAAYIRGLADKGKTVYEIEDVLEGYTSVQQIEAVLGGCDAGIAVQLTNFTLEPDQLRLTPGVNRRLKLSIEPRILAASTKIVWSSSDEKVAVVDADGNVRALTPGRSTIAATVYADNLSSKCEATVTYAGHAQLLNRIDQLHIGALVVDNSWLWEHRAGFGYTGKGLISPVRWIVVAKNHYDLGVPHVTLLSEELLAYYSFDKCEGGGNSQLTSEWVSVGRSSSLRVFLSEVFAGSFSAIFAEKLIPIRRDPKTSAEDYAFILSADELGGNEQGQLKTKRIGMALPYFKDRDRKLVEKRRGARFKKKVTAEQGQFQLSSHIWDVFEVENLNDSGLEGDTYWTCSPVSYRNGNLYIVFPDGRLAHVPGNDADTPINAVRVAINIRADTLVAENPNRAGCYEFDGLKVMVENIKLNPDYLEINSGDSVELSATFEPDYASDTSVVYESSEESVAVVDTNGILKAVKEGEATISVKSLDSSGALAICQVVVKETGKRIKLGDLQIGARVVDQSWLWEHKKGPNYSGTGVKKPVIWIIVANNHYAVEGDAENSTLMAEGLIANYCFDDSIFRGDFLTTWAQSGLPNASRGLRPFLNSTLELPKQLRFHLVVAGTMFEQRYNDISKLNRDSMVRLQREPENEYDRNAIAVLDSEGNKLGFVPADLADFLAPVIDRGAHLVVEIAEIRPGEKNGVSGAKVQLELIIKLNCDQTCRDYIESSFSAYDSFYNAFSTGFRNNVLITDVPHVDIETREVYYTKDRVFVPSHTELCGGSGPLNNYNISDFQGFELNVGRELPFFAGTSQNDLGKKRLPVDVEGFSYYWTRSLCRSGFHRYHGNGRFLNSGELLAVHVYSYHEGYMATIHAESDIVGVRPMVNLRADTMVYAKHGSDGVYYLSTNA